jgi:hypothetical protein
VAQVTGERRGQLGRQRLGRIGRERGAVHVRHLPCLVGQRVGDLAVSMPQRRDEGAAHRVEVALAVGVFEPTPFAAQDARK